MEGPSTNIDDIVNNGKMLSSDDADMVKLDGKDQL